MTADTIVDTFAGPGGWDEGARIAGHTGRIVGIEWSPDACATAEAAGHERIQADVSRYPLDEFAGADGLIASPPCPTFSTAGNGAGKLDMDKVHDRIRAFANGRQPEQVEWEDERSALTAEPMRWAYALRPRWIACEQVPAVLPLWQHIAMLLRGLGYKTWTGVVSAEEYGVAQTRKRTILIARRDGLPALPPAPTHQPYRPGLAPQLEDDLFGTALPAPVSMAQALGWLDPTMSLRNGTQTNACTRSAEEPAGTIFFGQRSNAVDWVQRSNYSNGGNSQERGERLPSEPSSTLTGKPPSWAMTRPSTTVCGDARIGRPGHKDRDKGEAQFAKDSVRISVEEAGVLQSFPADYPWQGGKSSQYLQVGNAVPPLLAAAILRPLLTAHAAEEAA